METRAATLQRRDDLTEADALISELRRQLAFERAQGVADAAMIKGLKIVNAGEREEARSWRVGQSGWRPRCRSF
jgi:hypothetical protein